MPKKILILAGGFSAEREVSLVSGKGVEKALKQQGYEVVYHDLISVKNLLATLEKEKPDVVFNALHGNWGEDGEIQGFLDILQIPYTHSGLEASLIGMNKFLTKKICQSYGIKTADYELMTYEQFKNNGTELLYPYVVKPCQDGSSVGVFIVRDDNDKKQVTYDDEQRLLLVEKYIAGHELTVAVINGKACGVTELCPKVDFYDYKAKYTNGMTEHVLPANIPEDIYNQALTYAQTVHEVLNCNTVSRSDFRYNEADGVVFLEVNTNPGLTPLSLVPEQAEYIGISYEQLCAMLVENAKCRKIG